MLVADKSLRSLKNPDTGLDVSIPSVREIEAPLGGTSIEYEILVLTKLPIYKSQFHKENDVVRYTIQRAYREIEDFYEKVEKKFKDISVPIIPKGREVSRFSTEDKRAKLDEFMQHISKHKEICQSTIFSNFIGIDKLKSQRTAVFSEEAALTSIDDSLDEKNKIIKNSCLNNVDNNSGENLDQANISELFPKMKMRKSSKPEASLTSVDNSLYTDSALFPMSGKDKYLDQEDDLDLFEEAKKVPKFINQEDKHFVSDREADNDPFDDSKKKFTTASSKHLESEEINNIDIRKENRAKLQSEKNSLIPDNSSADRREISVDSEEINNLNLSSSEEGARENKTVGVSLFEELDFGVAITRDDENLFVVEKNEEGNKLVVNPLLSPTRDSDADDSGVSESLEDLMNLQQPSVSSSKPQKHSARELDHKTAIISKPVVSPPRNVKPAQEKPQIAPKKMSMTTKPTVSQKPLLPPKPKVLKKPSISQTAANNEVQEEANASMNKQQSKLFDDLSDFDIMKYIEQEEKVASTGASLFD